MNVMNAPSVGSARNAVGKYGKGMCSVPGSVRMFGQVP